MEEIKTRHQVSEDELNYRMEQKRKLQDEPVQKAVAILENAVDKVLTGLGVDVNADNIAEQMNNLGITMTENTEEATPQLNGFFIFLTRNEDLVPYAWVGSARLNHLGECFCDIQYFMDNRLVEIGGSKIV